jgi:sugar phosphate isomerase/epimerase
VSTSLDRLAARPLSRRGFLGAAGGVALGAAIGGARGAAASTHGEGNGVVTRDKLGVQLWSCLTAYEADTPETFALIASTGYAFVEYAFGFGSLGTPKAFRKALDDTGLWCNGGHDLSPYPYSDKAWKQHVEDSMVIGVRGLGHNTSFPTTVSDTMKYVDALHKGHEVARKMGFKGYIYNHMEAAQWNRLTDRPGTYAIELVLQHTTPDVFACELDSAHTLAALGSLNAVNNMIRKYPGRFPLLHMKDGFAPPYLPDGTIPVFPLNGAEFGTGDYGRPDIADRKGRPHAGFQDLLTAVRESNNWNDVLLLAESDGSQATNFDYTTLAYRGLNGLRFPYRNRH